MLFEHSLVFAGLALACVLAHGNSNEEQNGDQNLPDVIIQIVKFCQFRCLFYFIFWAAETCERTSKAGDLLSVHYNGTLASDNSEFDSSHKRGMALNFQLGFGEVIPGWEKGMAGMCIGEIRRLTIPPHLGYGDQGSKVVPGDSTVVFDVELVDIQDGKSPSNIFKHADVDHNKKLDKTEVATYFKKEAARMNLNSTEWDISDMVWEVFEIDDRNKDGFITRREFSGPVKDEM